MIELYGSINEEKKLNGFVNYCGEPGPKGDKGNPGEPGPAGLGVIQGGTTGLVLAKKSNTDYDTEWINAGAGTVISVNGLTGIVELDAEDVGALPDSTVIPTKTSDLTNDSGFLTLHLDISGKANITYVDDQIDIIESEIPTKTSELINDSGFLTEHQSLSAYRTSANQDIIDATKQATLVSGTNIKTINNQSILGSGNIDIQGGGDVTDVKINNTSILSNTVANIPIAGTSTLGVVKVEPGDRGIKVDGNNGLLSVLKAHDNEIAGKTQLYRPIVPANLDLATMEGLGNNSLTWTDQYKSNARTTIGAGTVSNLSDLSITATNTELNVLDGITATTAELNYVDGVTSNILTQINSKQPNLVSGTNIKTINSQSILGSGNIEILSGGEPSAYLKSASSSGNTLTLVNKDDSITTYTPTIPTKTSDLTNDSGFIDNTYHDSTKYDASNPSGFITNSALSGYATESWVEGKGYLTEHQSLANYSTTSEMNTAISNHHDSTKQDLITSSNKLSYNLLSDTPTIPTVPTNVSAFTNDAGYLTSHQSLSAYRTSADQDVIDAGKQDTLTAGSNISISNNTISATDTTYSAGNGIAITNNVISSTVTFTLSGTELTITTT